MVPGREPGSPVSRFQKLVARTGEGGPGTQKTERKDKGAVETGGGRMGNTKAHQTQIGWRRGGVSIFITPGGRLGQGWECGSGQIQGGGGGLTDRPHRGGPLYSGVTRVGMGCGGLSSGGNGLNTHTEMGEKQKTIRETVQGWGKCICISLRGWGDRGLKQLPIGRCEKTCQEGNTLLPSHPKGGKL